MNENKKIAINTVILTIKLLVIMVCGFVVSRLILHALGADNYGLYNVVGGIVSMLALVSTSMVATTYRYIAVERGKGNSGNPQRIYSTLMLIHVALALLLIIIGEPLGAFYIYNYLNVTNASLADAHFVFLFSLIAMFFTVIAVPSNGLLIAEEKFLSMSVIDILRTLLNVAMAFFLLEYAGNRLRLYSVLMAVLTIGNRIAFQAYCQYKYPQIVKFKLNRNIKDYKEIISFTGWTLIGASAVIGRTQGVAMVINMFFRNSINAAFGVAIQVEHAAIQFTNTLRQSVTPQIMKNQGGNSSRSLSLVYAISRYTYLIMLIISVPLLLCMDTILTLWLGADNVPPLTSVFASLLLISGMVGNLKSGFDASIQATGKIKKNQIGYTFINLSIIPIVYFLYAIGLPAYMNAFAAIILNVATIVYQAFIMRELTTFTFRDYLNKTLYPSFIATICAFVPMLFLRCYLGENVYIVVSFALVATIWSCIAVFFCGINKNERERAFSFINKKMCRLTKKVEYAGNE